MTYLQQVDVTYWRADYRPSEVSNNEAPGTPPPQPHDETLYDGRWVISGRTYLKQYVGTLQMDGGPGFRTELFYAIEDRNNNGQADENEPGVLIENRYRVNYTDTAIPETSSETSSEELERVSVSRIETPMGDNIRMGTFNVNETSPNDSVRVTRVQDRSLRISKKQTSDMEVRNIQLGNYTGSFTATGYRYAFLNVSLSTFRNNNVVPFDESMGQVTLKVTFIREDQPFELEGLPKIEDEIVMTSSGGIQIEIPEGCRISSLAVVFETESNVDMIMDNPVFVR